MRMLEKVALVTGGAAGIGRATALRFAEEGGKVAICDLNEAAGMAVVAELGALGAEAMFHKVNVANRDEVRDWVAVVVARFGRIDVLVNNAGIVRDSQLVKVKEGELEGEMAEADFDLVVAVNLKGVYNCTQAVAPQMIKQGGGVILNASSVVGLDGNFGQTNYVATQGRRRWDDEGVGARTGPVWHPRQRRSAGVYRHGHHQGHARKDHRGPQSAHAAGPYGRAAGYCERIPVFGVGRGSVYFRRDAARGRRTGGGDVRG